MTDIEFMIAPATAALVFEEPTIWVDRSLSTASWWDQYEIQVGMYAFEWVNINGKPWNANPEALTNGFIANTGPYYGMVVVEAKLTEEYRVNRLFTEQSSHHEVHEEPQVTTMRSMVYAYQLPGCPKGQHGRPLMSHMGGTVVPIEDL